MFTNKHVIVAMLVAPLLAILAWFAVGSFVAEKPAPAQAGQAYPLVEKSSCRYASGVCELENNDLRVTLSFDDGEGRLLLESSHALDSAVLSVVDDGDETLPQTLQPVAGEGHRWALLLPRRPGPEARLRVALSRAGAAYFVETSTAFLQGAEERS